MAVPYFLRLKRGGENMVAGIDASTTKTSVALFSDDGKYLEHILIDLSSSKYKDIDIRLPKMMCDICQYLDGKDINKIIIEKSMKQSNIQTLQKLSYISGAIMCYAARRNIVFDNPLPSQWRKKIGLEQSKNVERKALKAEAIKAVQMEYCLNVTDDEAEAILLARSAFDLPKIEVTVDDVIDDIL